MGGTEIGGVMPLHIEMEETSKAFCYVKMKRLHKNTRQYCLDRWSCGVVECLIGSLHTATLARSVGNSLPL